MAQKLNGLVRKVNAALAGALSDFRGDLQRATRNGRIIGYIVSSDFEGRDHTERQRILRTVLEPQLTPDELEDVGPIVTMTPAEAQIKETA